MKKNTEKKILSDSPVWSPLHGKIFNTRKKRHPRDRGATEQRILDSLAKAATKGGILFMHINQFAKEANVSKSLIYRYFGGMPGLIAHYAKKVMEEIGRQTNITIPENLPPDELRKAIKHLYRFRSELYYKNQEWRILTREVLYSLQNAGKFIIERHPTNIILYTALGAYPHISHADIDAFDMAIVAAHGGILTLMETPGSLNGIDLRRENEREKFHGIIDAMIDAWLDDKTGGADAAGAIVPV